MPLRNVAVITVTSILNATAGSNNQDLRSLVQKETGKKKTNAPRNSWRLRLDKPPNFTGSSCALPLSGYLDCLVTILLVSAPDVSAFVKE